MVLGASESTGSRGRTQSCFGPARRVGFSTVTWGCPENSHCGLTQGRSVAGEALGEYDTYTFAIFYWPFHAQTTAKYKFHRFLDSLKVCVHL